MSFSKKVVDVICQHTRDSKIIPMRVRIQDEDEDGEFHTYNIKAYKDTSSSSTYQMLNGVYAAKGIWTLECKIVVFDNIKKVNLFYNPSDNKWVIR